MAHESDAVRPLDVSREPPATEWMPGIEALRGIAAVSVAVFHVWALTSAPSFPGYQMLLGLGSWAVDVFFLLSGFLLVQAFWEVPRRSSLRQFYIRRFFRIAPAYYACLAVLFLLLAQRELLFSGSGLTQVLANLTFTQWLSPTTASSLNVSGVFWTLSIEAFLYALLPVFAWLIARRPLLFGGSLFAAGMAYRLFVTMDGAWLGDAVFRSLPNEPETIMRLFLLRQFPGIVPIFVMGMLLRWWLHFRPGASRPTLDSPLMSTNVLVALLVPSMLVLFAVIQANDFRNAWLFVLFDVVVCALLLPALAYAGRGDAGSLSFGAQVLQWLGRRSFGIYLWHFPVILVVMERGPMVRPADQSMLGIRLMVIAVVTLLLGALSYRWVELPGRRVGRLLAAAAG